MARNLASAWVSVSPTGFKTFAQQTQLGLKKSLAGVSAQIPVTANTTQANLSVDKLKTRLADLSRQVTEVKFSPKDKEAVAAIAGLNVRLDRLGAKVSQPKITLEGERRALADIAAIDLALDRLNRKQARPSLGSRAVGGIGNLIPGLAGTGGSAGSSAAGLAALAPSGLLNPYTIIAGLAALPFAAQAAAGGIVAALGGGLTAVGIIGAAKAKDVQGAWSALTTSIGEDVKQIGKPFVPVIAHILAMFNILADELTPVFTRAMQTIAPALQQFGDALVRAFGQPAVQQAIKDVAKAFGDILKAVAPTLPGIIEGLAQGISNISKAISRNPQAFSAFISFLGQVAEFALKAIAWLTNVATYIEEHFVPAFKRARHDVAHWWDDMTNDIAKSMNIVSESVGIAFDEIKLSALGAVQFILNIMGKLPGPLGAPFRAAAKDIGNSMAGIQADVAQRTAQIQDDLDSIHPPPPVHVQVIAEASGTGNISITGSGWALGQGNIRFHAAQGGFISGGEAGRDSVPAMLMPGELVVPTRMVAAGAVDHLRGRLPGFAAGGLAGGIQAGINAIPGPAGQMAGTDAGRAVTTGVEQAMAKFKAAVKAKAAQPDPFAGITGIPSGGQISGSAAAAMNFARSILWAYGWGADQFPSLQALWMGESGWRWNALNGASGAYGIPQSLPASKMSSAGPDWQTNPATQIRWGLAYIKTSYGSPSRAYSQWLARSPHWYAAGGVVGELPSMPAGHKAFIPPKPSMHLYRGQPSGAVTGDLWASGFGVRQLGADGWQPYFVPGMAAGGLAGGTLTDQVAAIRTGLSDAQAGEKAKYFGLTHSLALDLAKPGSWASGRRAMVTGKLSALAARQRAEESAFRALAGKGLSTANLHVLASAARAESGTATATEFGTPHPLWTKDLRGFLGQLGGIGAAGLPYGVNWAGQIYNLPPFAGGLQSVASGPAVTYDSGGWIMPGTTVVRNRTGAPERVTPSGAMTTGEAAIVAALERNTQAVREQAFLFGQVMSGSASRSASRGYYGGR